MDEADPVATLQTRNGRRGRTACGRSAGGPTRTSSEASSSPRHARSAEAFELVGPGEGEVFRGLHHLAAAGYRHQTGEAERAARQLAHARRRLASFPDCAEQVRAVERLLAS